MNKTDKIFRDGLKNYSPSVPDSIKNSVLDAIAGNSHKKPIFTWGRGLVAVITVSVVSLLGWQLSGEKNDSVVVNKQQTAIINAKTEPVISSATTQELKNNSQLSLRTEAKQETPVSNTAIIAEHKSKIGSTRGISANDKSKVNKEPNLNVVVQSNSLDTHDSPKNDSKATIGNSTVNIETPAVSNEVVIENKHAESSNQQNTNIVTSEAVNPELTKTKVKSDVTAFAIDFSAGPSFYSSKIGQNKNGNAEYTTAMESAIDELISANAAIEFSMQMKNKVFIQTGINYDWIRESFTYQMQQTGPVQSDLIKETNAYEYLSIPVLLGMNFEIGKFSFKPQGGISMMFLTKAEGYTIDQITYQPVTFEKTVPPFNNTILGVLFRATVQYQASEHLGFYVQPAVRLSTRSVYDTDYPIGKELTRFNANIGLQYRF